MEENVRRELQAARDVPPISDTSVKGGPTLRKRYFQEASPDHGVKPRG